MKIAMIADVHVEKNKNLEHIIDCCKWVGDELVKNNIKHLFVLGDFINSRIKIDSLVINTAIQILEQWESLGLNVYLILGNHELYYKENKEDETEVTSIKPFKRLCKVIETYEVITLEDTNIHCIPWITNLNRYKEILKSINFNESDLILSHTEVFGSIVNGSYSIRDSNGISSDLFKVKTFLGHYHERQDLYVGSPISLNFGESSKNKGITIFDLETKETNFIQNPKSELYKTISLEELKDLDKEKIKFSKFIRILLTEKISEEEKINLIDKFSNKQIVFKPMYSEKSDSVTIKENTLEDIIKEYVNAFAEDLDKERLLKMCKDLYERKLNNVIQAN